MTVVAGRLLGDSAPVRLQLSGGRIEAVCPDADAPDHLIVPGLVDLQVNGYHGVDLNDGRLDAAAVARLVELEWAAGVAAFCPTLVSAPEQQLCDALAAIAQARRADPLVAASIPAVHVEGPALSAEDGPRGAHDPAALRPPDLAELARWQRAAAGAVGIVTLAPELPGSLEYVRGASAAGVLVALGHSAAHPRTITAAVDAGARLSTHLGNGCALTLARHDNPLWAQLADDRLSASFIADGHHLPAAVATVMLRAKTVARAVLISDSVALAGLPPGRYRDTSVGGDVTLHPDGRLSLTGSALLAGSASSLLRGLEWVTTVLGLSLADAVAMASHNPNRLLGRPAPLALAPGAPATLTVLARDAAGRLACVATYRDGVAVAGSGAARR